jgi:tRNA-dihydrouridine synthase
MLSKLKFYPGELPLVLQLGGNDPYNLAECCKMAEDLGYARCGSIDFQIYSSFTKL